MTNSSEKIYLNAAMAEGELPVVTVVIPMLNEKDSIKRCLFSIAGQDYPQDKIEIIVVDGLSQDGSREMVLHFSQRHRQAILLDNKVKRTPAALNIGIKNAKGTVVIILGAHTKISPDFIGLNIKYMKELGVRCVGGTQVNVGETFIQQAIGYAMGSLFGIPSAPYRFRKNKGYVDTVVYAAYDKDLFYEIGFFDEKHLISEDAELNWRIRKAGYKIFYTPEIVSYYYPRKNIKGLFKQFYNYGILRSNVIKKHISAIKLIHIIPPVFTILVLITALMGLVDARYLIVLFVLLALYFSYLVLASVVTSIELKSCIYFIVLPVIFFAMQISWALGFLSGIFIRNAKTN